MLSRIQNFFIKEALEQQETVFGRVKIHTLFAIIVFHTVVYIVGSIPLFMGDYPILQLLQIIGLLFILLIAFALKKTKHYKAPGIVWMIGGFVYTLIACIASQGSSSFLSYTVLILNIIISFLLLEKYLLRINLVFYIVYAVLTLSVSANYVPKLDFGLHLERELEFLNQSNIFPIVLMLLMISYIVKVYSISHQKALNNIADQEEEAIQQQSIITSKSEAYANSIDYAYEIQNTILSQSNQFQSFFKDHFIFFKPKSKLSSNFYYAMEKEDLIYFAVVDVGYGGVSGAILSMICQNGLQDAINELNLKSPSAIIQYLGHYTEKTLQKSDQKEGISASICTFNKKNRKLFYAGANMPILIVSGDQISEYNGSTAPLKKNSQSIAYKNEEIHVAINDVVYLFTNGIVNQLQAANGNKKVMEILKKILLNSRNQPLGEQKISFSSAFNGWIKETEQVDDVCVIALKI